MDKFIRIITCSTEIEKPAPVAPPREPLNKKNSENHYVLGPTQSTAGTSEDFTVYAVQNELNGTLVKDESDDDLYMDLSTYSKTTYQMPTEPVETAVKPVPAPRGINAKKVAKMIPPIENGSGFSHIPEERKAKLLNSLKNHLKKNKI